MTLSGFPALPDDSKSVVDAFVQKGQPPEVLTNTLASLMFVRSHNLHPELDADCVAFVSPRGHYVDAERWRMPAVGLMVVRSWWAGTLRT